MRNENQKWILMARYLAGEMEANEEISYRKKVEGDPEFRIELKEMETQWKNTNELASGKKPDTRKAWNSLYGRLEKDGLLIDQKINPGRSRWSGISRIAAIVLLLIAVGIPIAYVSGLRSDKDESMEERIAEKGVRSVDLPDGSRVFLNQGSVIGYPGSFEKERSIELDGEAYFEVMSDPVNPFTVRSGKVVVSVLGTSFNVKNNKENGDVEIFVSSGKVRVARLGSDEFTTLLPGDVAISSEESLQVSAMKDPNYISWKTKDFKFVNTALEKVLRELEESYHVTIESGELDLDELRITTSYSEQSIDAILETIGTAFDFTISKNKDHYYLKD